MHTCRCEVTGEGNQGTGGRGSRLSSWQAPTRDSIMLRTDSANLPGVMRAICSWMSCTHGKEVKLTTSVALRSCHAQSENGVRAVDEVVTRRLQRSLDGVVVLDVRLPVQIANAVLAKWLLPSLPKTRYAVVAFHAPRGGSIHAESCSHLRCTRHVFCYILCTWHHASIA